MANLPTAFTVTDIIIDDGDRSGDFRSQGENIYYSSQASSRVNLGVQYPSSTINLPYLFIATLPRGCTVMTAKSLFGNSTVAIDTASKAGYVRAIVTMLASSSSTVTDDIILMFN